MAITFNTLPTDMAQGVFKSAQAGSALAKIAAATPQMFGNVQYHILSQRPKAELVGAGAAKHDSGGALTSKTVAPLKAQVTIRFPEELKWADSERQMGALRTLADAGALALARQVDLAAIHGVSALQGTAYSQITEFAMKAEKSVQVTPGEPSGAVSAAVGLLVAGGAPTGIALDSQFAYALATEKNANGAPVNPGLGFGGDISNFNGLNAGVSDTVSGAAELAGGDSGLRGLVIGDNAFAWGVQEEVGVKYFETGDPDNSGRDLAGHNEIALRMELVFSVAWLDLGRVAKITDGIA